MTFNTKVNYFLSTADQVLPCSLNIHLKIHLYIIIIVSAKCHFMPLYYTLFEAHTRGGVAAEIDINYASCLIK